MIRQGRENFTVRPLTQSEVLDHCPRVAQLATSRYKGAVSAEQQDDFVQRTQAMCAVPGTAEFVGCFQENTLVGFSENYIQGNAVVLNVIRHDPAYLNKYSSYALIDWMLTHYLNERKMRYVLGGSRSSCDNDIQDLLASLFGFTREYARLHAAYSPWLQLAVKFAYPFRSWLSNLSEEDGKSCRNRLGTVIQQDHIVRACANIPEDAVKTGRTNVEAGEPNLRIVPTNTGHLSAITGLHMSGIPGSFLGSLGPRVLSRVYEGILKSEYAFGFAAVKDGQVVGFICCTENLGATYKSVLTWDFLPLFVSIIPKTLKWKNIKNALETLLYPVHVKQELPRAEVLSIVVSEEARGYGVGRLLMNSAMAEFQRRRVNDVKVMVGEDLPSNHFYKKLGFQFLCQYSHHGYNLNAYVRKVGTEDHAKSAGPAPE